MNTDTSSCPSVAVVILNWNGKKFLEQFLPILQKCTPSNVAEIIVADNASTDDSVEFMRAEHPNIRLIENKDNYGFAQGYNEALKHIESKYYILLNSDIEVTPNWVQPVIALMEEDSEIAAAQPKLLSYYQRNHFEYAGGAGGFIDKFGYPFCRGRIFNSIEEDKGQYNKPCEIFWATGAALFVRADLYRKYGGLDNDFFAHMEEIDFCWRLKNVGYKIMYCPYSTVYHIGGGTLPKSSAQKTFLNFRNNLSLLYKNLTPKRFRSVLCCRFFLDFVAACSFLTSTGLAEFKAVFAAYFAFAKLHKKNKEKKDLLIQHRYTTLMYKGSIVKDYYLGKIKKFSSLNPNKFYTEANSASTPKR